ncbi:hypothetical protein T4B_12878 [Trichinella pseudospiralis]|uniref:Uncharacterized protein n=1 Tax=Trichinella pseudospiralis TaxID=6337 RepID=A0A0V1K2J5_TRIPS|nr:hypothetical protein T4B_12878 [Trichinella pseudospiralis]KRZ41450.1 hypothetical protein T4C_5816 [Trichinella pseudospiralis]
MESTLPYKNRAQLWENSTGLAKCLHSCNEKAACVHSSRWHTAQGGRKVAYVCVGVWENSRYVQNVKRVRAQARKTRARMQRTRATLLHKTCTGTDKICKPFFGDNGTRLFWGRRQKGEKGTRPDRTRVKLLGENTCWQDKTPADFSGENCTGPDETRAQFSVLYGIGKDKMGRGVVEKTPKIGRKPEKISEENNTKPDKSLVEAPGVQSCGENTASCQIERSIVAVMKTAGKKRKREKEWAEETGRNKARALLLMGQVTGPDKTGAELLGENCTRQGKNYPLFWKGMG